MKIVDILRQNSSLLNGKVINLLLNPLAVGEEKTVYRDNSVVIDPYIVETLVVNIDMDVSTITDPGHYEKLLVDTSKSVSITIDEFDNLIITI